MSASERIVITGGKGMLAQAFARVLGGRGVTPLLCGREACDVSDRRSVEAAFDRLRPGLVINCAGYTKVDLAEKEAESADAANGLAAGILAAQCRRHDATLVHFSTDYVFDGTIGRPLRPDDPVGPRSAYGRSKLLGERAIQDDPPPRWLIVRTAWLYGAGGPNFVQTMVNAARGGKLLRVVNDQHGSPTYTIDLAEATADLLARGAQGIWHVTNAGETTWFDFAAAIFQEFGLTPTLLPITSEEWKSTRPESAERPKYSVLDVGPIARLRGRPMRHWRDALRAFKADIDARGGF
jgi:dTDP-4-dehydrorhamnose reductase